jgi:signal transduction histidine kinase/CHASE3 domain sensor protein
MKKFLFKSALFLRVIFLLSLFVILLIGGFMYRHISNLTNSTKLVISTYKVNVELEHVMSYLRAAESGHRNYILTNDSLYLEPYFNAEEKVNNSIILLKQLTKANSKQQENLTILNKLSDSLFSNFSKTLDFVEIDETSIETYKNLFFEEKIIIENLRLQVNDMIDLENNLLTNRQKEYQSDLQFTPLFFYLVLLVTLVLIIFAYNKINNDFKSIKTMNDQLLIFKESTNQLEIIGEHGYWVWHIGSNIFTYSDYLYRLLGEEPQSFEANFDNFLKFVHPEDVDRLAKELDKMIENEELPFVIYRFVKKNGSTKYLKAYAKAFYSVDGQKRLLGTTSDITDEIENFLALEERNLELEHNNNELSEFNYVASHDLQEPLRKIQTFISRLEEKESKNFSNTGLQYLERINVAVTRMRLLIDDLLQFSRTNKPDKDFVLTDLNELFENAKQDVAVTILDKKAKITNDNLPSTAVIPFQIQQLFLNLLSNSLKYSKENIAPSITIGYSIVKSTEESQLAKAVKNHYHKITFTDNGIGFDQKYANQIFELFNRLHNKSDFSGTGVGLAICKKITDNHNGFIFAEGKLDQGAIFTVYLPAS